jgi:formate hydrogenlyase transcriptional activator
MFDWWRRRTGIWKRWSAKQFREDLYFRLNVFPIRVPPLRERQGDIPLLVQYYMDKYARRMKRRIDSIPSSAMNAMTEYHWPGNARELENFIERSVILSLGSELRPPLVELTQQKRLSAPLSESKLATRTEAEREHILRTLKDAKWRIGGPTGAAARLGMKRTTLHSLVKRLGIGRES